MSAWSGRNCRRGHSRASRTRQERDFLARYEAIHGKAPADRKTFRGFFRLNDGRAFTWEQFHPDIETAQNKMLEAARTEYPGEIHSHIIAEVNGPGGDVVEGCKRRA